MSMHGAETVLADRWIKSTLLADPGVAALAGIRVYEGFAPEPPDGLETVWPVVIFSHEYSPDVIGVGNVRVMVDGTWIIKAVAQTDSYDGTLARVAAAIDTALVTPAGTVAATVEDGAVLNCRRVETFRMTEVEGGLQWRHLGGRYRIVVQAD